VGVYLCQAVNEFPRTQWRLPSPEFFFFFFFLLPGALFQHPQLWSYCSAPRRVMARTWDEPKEGCQPSNYVNHIGTKRRQVVGFYYDRKWRVLISNSQPLGCGLSALPLFYFPYIIIYSKRGQKWLKMTKNAQKCPK